MMRLYLEDCLQNFTVLGGSQRNMLTLWRYPYNVFSGKICTISWQLAIQILAVFYSGKANEVAKSLPMPISKKTNATLKEYRKDCEENDNVWKASNVSERECVCVCERESV